MAYKALSLRPYGVLFLSIAYQVRMNGLYFASMAYLGVCTAYELCTEYAPCAAVALPMRRCCVVEYFLRRCMSTYYVTTTMVGKKTYLFLFVLILFIVMDLYLTQAAAGSRE